MRVSGAAGAVDRPGAVALGLHPMTHRGSARQRCKDVFQIVCRVEYGLEVRQAQTDRTDGALVTVAQVTLQVSQDAGVAVALTQKGKVRT